jgi:cobalamin biosynthesis Mg chelatase CobN
MIAFTMVGLGLVGPVLLVNAVATAAVTGTRSAPSTTVPLARRRAIAKAPTQRRPRRLRKVVHVARSTTTSSPSSTSTRTTSTTVARKPSPANTRRAARGRANRTVAARPVSAHHSGVSPLTVILVLMVVAPLGILGLGLVGSELGSTRSRHRRKSVGIPPQP